MTLEGRRVLIIGGGSGIGLGIAKACLAQGATVGLAGRSEAKLRARCLELGPRAIAEPADATVEADVERLLERPVDHVVLTAVHPYYAPVRALELAGARAAFESKLLPALLVAKHARFERGGSLVLTSGINALRPTPGGSAVAAANGALEALARTLSVELAPVRVNVLAPGWVDTPVWDAVAGSAKAARFEAQAAKLPAGRIGTPADLASAALFLMSNGFVTGAVLRVDGGHPLV